MPVKFSEEFQRDAVALVLTQGMSQKQVCADLGTSKSALQAWVRNAELVGEMAAAGTRSGVSVAVACRVLGFSKQAYCQLLREPVSDRDWDEAHLINAARDVWDEVHCQGYRLIADELVDDGWQVSERRV